MTGWGDCDVCHHLVIRQKLVEAVSEEWHADVADVPPCLREGARLEGVIERRFGLEFGISVLSDRKLHLFNLTMPAYHARVRLEIF